MPRLTLIGGVLWGNSLYSASVHAAVVEEGRGGGIKIQLVLRLTLLYWPHQDSQSAP